MTESWWNGNGRAYKVISAVVTGVVTAGGIGGYSYYALRGGSEPSGSASTEVAAATLDARVRANAERIQRNEGRLDALSERVDKLEDGSHIRPAQETREHFRSDDERFRAMDQRLRELEMRRR